MLSGMLLIEVFFLPFQRLVNSVRSYFENCQVHHLYPLILECSKHIGQELTSSKLIHVLLVVFSVKQSEATLCSLFIFKFAFICLFVKYIHTYIYTCMPSFCFIKGILKIEPNTSYRMVNN